MKKFSSDLRKAANRFLSTRSQDEGGQRSVYNLIDLAIFLIWFYLVVEANYERDMMELDQKAMDFERMVRFYGEHRFKKTS